MSKYRCPVCGAPHKDPVAKCRLCGQNMASPQAVPVSTSGARMAGSPRKGIGVLALIAVGVILAICVGALVFGASRENDAISDVAKKLPGVNEVPDGWITIEDPEGGFTAAMPPGSTSDSKLTQATPAAAGGWVGEIGEESVESIAYYDPVPEAGASANEQLNTFARSLETGRPGAHLNLPVTETNFAGYTALEISLRYDSQQATSKALLILKDGRVYMLEDYSVYEDHPSYPKLVGGFSFVAPTAATST